MFAEFELYVFKLVALSTYNSFTMFTTYAQPLVHRHLGFWDCFGLGFVFCFEGYIRRKLQLVE